MKKAIALLLAALMAFTFLVSCGDSGGGASDAFLHLDDTSSGSTSNIAPSAPSSGGGTYTAAESPMADTADRGENQTWTSGSGITPTTGMFSDAALGEKIIYTVSADIETVGYEETIEKVYDLMAFNGAFIENADIGGRNLEYRYREWQTMRQARFTIRVPRDRLNAVTASLDTLGNVTVLRSDADNITAQFSDTESRLNSLRVQEERLLDMLKRAENIEDMLDIEERLAGVRYQVESLTTALRNWQNLIDYSTVRLFIVEVVEFTEVEEDTYAKLTYWQQLGYGITESAKGVGRFFMGLFKAIVVSLPVLIVIAAFAAAIIIIVRIVSKRAKKRRAEYLEKHPKHPNTPYPPNTSYPPNTPYPPNASYPPNTPNPQNTPFPQNPPFPPNTSFPPNASYTQSPPTPKNPPTPNNTPFPQPPPHALTPPHTQETQDTTQHGHDAQNELSGQDAQDAQDPPGK